MQDPLPFGQSTIPASATKRTSKLDVGDLILALCEAGEWDLALRMAREAARD